MTMAAQPSFEYLLSASTTSLEALQLARLDQIAALKSQITEAVESWATAELDVRLTRLILETRLTLSEPQPPALAHFHPLPPATWPPSEQAALGITMHLLPAAQTRPPSRPVRAHVPRAAPLFTHSTASAKLGHAAPLSAEAPAFAELSALAPFSSPAPSPTLTVLRDAILVLSAAHVGLRPRLS